MYQKNVYLTTLEQAIIITALAEFAEAHFVCDEEISRSISEDLMVDATKSIYKKIVQSKHEKLNEVEEKGLNN